VTVPAPWQLSSTTALAFLPELVLWYLMVLLAPVGVAAGLRRDPWVTFLLAGYVCVGAVIISLPSGNIGTFIRMRDMVVPFVACLSALGACVVIERIAKGRVAVRTSARSFDRKTEELHATSR
jgi:hypothetical protein